MTSNNIKYYYDTMSPPSRALYLLFKLDKVPIEPKLVALRNGEHLTDEYRKNVNRFSKVPALHDSNGFKLSESVAILRYLSTKGLISDQWYPSEIKHRARVDEFLEWQHNNTFMLCGLYFVKKWRDPLMLGTKADPDELAMIELMLEQTMDTLENVWLKDNKFLCGDHITIADLFAASALEQSTIAGYEPSKNRPRISRWMKEVQHITNPYYDDVHKYVYKYRAAKL